MIPFTTQQTKVTCPECHCKVWVRGMKLAKHTFVDFESQTRMLCRGSGTKA